MSPADSIAQEKIIQSMQQRLATNANDTAAQLGLANALYNVGRHSEAVTAYQSYLRSNPSNANAATDMAFSMYQSGDVDGAVATLKRVLTANPRHQTAALNLAMMYVEKLSRGLAPAGQPVDSVKMRSYKDSMFLWLRTAAAIDSTTAQGQRASEILKQINTSPPGMPQ